jgi:hypothetical protein
MLLTLFVDTNCPRCGNLIRLAFVSRHPARSDAALCSHECAECGHVTTSDLSLRPMTRPPPKAAPAVSVDAETSADAPRALRDGRSQHTISRHAETEAPGRVHRARPAG